MRADPATRGPVVLWVAVLGAVLAGALPPATPRPAAPTAIETSLSPRSTGTGGHSRTGTASMTGAEPTTGTEPTTGAESTTGTESTTSSVSGVHPQAATETDNTGAGAAAPRGGPRDRDARLDWPLHPRPVVARAFDAGRSPYGPGHRGVDLLAAPGTPVRAAAEGFVLFAGPVAGRQVVSLDHDGGLRTTYEPVRPSVSAGERVHRGQVIGSVTAGHRGCAVRACLHWGLRRGEHYLDPLRFVGDMTTTLRLKPWDG